MGERRLRWLDALLPARCHGCDAPVAPHDVHAVCAACRLRLRRAPAPRCPRCDHPARFALGACPGCEPLPALVVSVRNAVLHRSPSDRLVRAFKYDSWRDLSRFMAERMARLAPAEARAVVPVPSSPRRMRRRGFNPAHDLARELAERLSLPLLEALVRPVETRRQVGLSPEERWSNVRDAFVPTADPSEVRGPLVLVDDVYTTGATAAAAAEALGRAGARSVHVLTFARAIPDLPHGAGPS